MKKSPSEVCPICEEDAGTLVEEKTETGDLIVEWVCLECGAVWDYIPKCTVCGKEMEEEKSGNQNWFYTCNCFH